MDLKAGDLTIEDSTVYYVYRRSRATLRQPHYVPLEGE
jgi:hypothetical protein